MTNMKLLKEIIDASGIKYSFIAEKIGISRQGLFKKFSDNTEFKAWQMLELSSILHLTEEQCREIFYSDSRQDANTTGE